MSGDQGATKLLAKIGEYEEELAQNPSSKVFVHLAEAYRKMDLLSEAAGSIEKGLTQHPDMVPAFICQGRIRTQQGDLDGAIFSFKEAMQRDAQNVYALQGLARVYVLRKEPGQAISLVKKLIKLRPDDHETIKLKSECEALVAATKQKKEVASPGAPIKTATMVDIYIKQGLLKDALAMCDEILKDNPDNTSILAKKEQVKGLLEASKTAAPSSQPFQEDVPVPTQENSRSHAGVLESWLNVINKRRTHV